MSTKQPQRASGRITAPVRLRPRQPSRAFLLFTAAALAVATLTLESRAQALRSPKVSGPDADVTACCDPLTGTCTETESSCPEGFTTLGLGTDCNPNCCEQPIATGGDNCEVVFVHEIAVPSEGASPVVVTITGDNSNATFDDYPDLCDLSIFDPDAAGPQDPGWWEAFFLDDCAIVRLDTCCTNPTHQPEWAFITSDCPCGETIAPSLSERLPGVFRRRRPDLR